MKKILVYLLVIGFILLPFTVQGGMDAGTAPAANSTLTGGITNVGTAGTGVVLAASTACKRVLIKATLDNTGNIYVGGSDVDKDTQNGFPLDAGEVWIGTVDNLADIWIDATVSGDGVSYTFEN